MSASEPHDESLSVSYQTPPASARASPSSPGGFHSPAVHAFKPPSGGGPGFQLDLVDARLTTLSSTPAMPLLGRDGSFFSCSWSASCLSSASPLTRSVSSMDISADALSASAARCVEDIFSSGLSSLICPCLSKSPCARRAADGGITSPGFSSPDFPSMMMVLLRLPGGPGDECLDTLPFPQAARYCDSTKDWPWRRRMIR